MDIKKGVGKKIQKFRKLKKITQEQLAEAIGIETISMSKIETGRSYPTSENLAKISAVLGVDPYELYMFNSDKSKKEILESIQKYIGEISQNDHKLVLLYNIIKGML